MDIFKILAILTFASGIFGIFVMWHEAAWKLSSETTDSPKLLTRWSYRYFIKIPAVQAFGREHAWLIFAITAPPAFLLYYLHRRFVRWTDPRKIEGRKKLAARAPWLGR